MGPPAVRKVKPDFPELVVFQDLGLNLFGLMDAQA